MFDVHFHPTEVDMDRNTQAIMQRALAVSVKGAMAAGVDETSCLQVMEMSKRVSSLVAAVGYHPWLVKEKMDWELLEKLCQQEEVVAVGEIGLDGKVEVPMTLQRECFERQLDLAKRYAKPVLIHSRGAVPETLEVLKTFKGIWGIMHAFGGDVNLASRFLDLGMCFSFVGTVTRPKAQKAHALARFIPADRMLLETDAPGIGMEGVPPDQVEPRHIVNIAEALAGLRMTSIEEISRQTDENVGRLLGERVKQIIETTRSYLINGCG